MQRVSPEAEAAHGIDNPAAVEAGIAAPAAAPAPQNANEGRWYIPTVVLAIALTLNVIRDFVWPITSFYDWNYKFKQTDDFMEQCLGQQLYSSIAVLLAIPIVAYTWAKIYGEPFGNCLRYGTIAGISTLSAIIPWDGFAKVGNDFFLARGFDNSTAAYLASLFPGPGTAEGPTQTTVTTGLSYFLYPQFSFDAVAFGLGYSPISWVPGNTWQFSYALLNDAAKKNIGGVFAQALAVSLSVAIMNFFYGIINPWLSKRIRNCCGMNTEVLRRSGSPVHREVAMQAVNLPALERGAQQNNI